MTQPNQQQVELNAEIPAEALLGLRAIISTRPVTDVISGSTLQFAEKALTTLGDCIARAEMHLDAAHTPVINNKKAETEGTP